MEETKKIGFDGAFSIDIGLELAGVAGPFVGLDRYATYTERVVWWGVCWPPLQCLSQFLSNERERDHL